MELTTYKKAQVAAKVDEVKDLPKFKLGPSEMHCIYKVPLGLRIIDPEAYSPKVVSIGPLHHGFDKLNEMENIKKINLQRILEKGGEIKVEKFFDIVYNHLDEVRCSYSEELKEISDDDLVNIIVFDALFLISLFISPALSCCDDFLLAIPLKMVSTDLLLLENQIPLFIVEKLFEEAKCLYTVVGSSNLNFMDLALQFLKLNHPQNMIQVESVKHLLHLVHLSDSSYCNGNMCQGKFLLKCFGLKEVISYIFEIPLYLIYKVLFCNGYGLLGTAEPYKDLSKTQSASELVAQGLTIQMKATDGLEIILDEGILDIPRFSLTYATSIKMRNLLAFEQCHLKVDPNFTSYVIFMGKLIKNINDVCILRERQIIVSDNLMDDEVVDMFYHLRKNLLHEEREDLFEYIYLDVIDFCEIPHHGWRRSLQEDYFNCPWKIIQTITGFLLLLFGSIRTYLACFNKKD